jgi:hypothetical protein
MEEAVIVISELLDNMELEDKLEEGVVLVTELKDIIVVAEEGVVCEDELFASSGVELKQAISVQAISPSSVQEQLLQSSLAGKLLPASYSLPS